MQKIQSHQFKVTLSNVNSFLQGRDLAFKTYISSGELLVPSLKQSGFGLEALD